MTEERGIAKVVRRSHLRKESSDFEYWQTQLPTARLAALEEIRREYHLWRYGGEPPFERVVCVISKNGKVIRHVGRK